MTQAKILDGKALANTLYEHIKQDIQALNAKVHLSVVLVGDNPASKIYVTQKQKTCEKIGISSSIDELPAEITQQKLLDHIDQLNQATHVNGILMQLPLPKHIDTSLIIEAIQPNKDVDGFHPINMGRLAQRNSGLRPCTPRGMIRLLEHYKIPIRGLHAVVVGASNIVGRPMAFELLLAGATVSVCHRFTENLASFVRQADILVAATGQRNLISSDWLKPSAVVLDVGIHRTDQGVCGDMDFASASQAASWISPVPGGVGPMTVAMLMSNTLAAYKLQQNCKIK